MSEQYPKVSVIVPVYKAEKYIERCVRSLMEQTLEDIEYIFVNDCTPDSSMDILRQVIADYPERQKSIQIIGHEKNLGSASVRNSGLNVSTGEYIIYCDSDDWVEKEMYEEMYHKARETEADVVGTDFYNEYISYSSLQKQVFPSDNLSCVKRMLRGELHCGACNKLVRRDIYSQNGIHFPDGVNMWEDVLTMIPVCFYSSKIVYLPKAYYHYSQFNTNSYTQRMSKNSLLNLIEAIQRLEVFLKLYELSDLEESLCYMKLTVKLNLLLNSTGKQQCVWNRLYPEAAPYSFSYTQMSAYWRIALKFAFIGLLPVFNAMAWWGKKIKKMLK